MVAWPAGSEWRNRRLNNTEVSLMKARHVVRAAAVLGAISLAPLTVGPVGSTPAESSTGYKRPLDVTLKVSGWCDNTGSDINVFGELSLGEVSAKVTLA